jgi:uncharacterized glyoxalase superfamily protein PhnB
MTQPATTIAPAESANSRPPSLTPYIMVADARRAIDWYVEILGARRRGELYVNPDDTIGHAELSLGNAVLKLSEPSALWPDVPVSAPQNPTTFSHTLHLDVADVDATTERARQAGAAVEREPADQPYGRAAVIVDPFGHRWMLMLTPPPAPATRLGQGDTANVAMRVPDVDRAKEFYAAVLQVAFSRAHRGLWRTEATTPPIGIWPAGDAAPGVQLTYRVDDIVAAVERVRAAGGQADAPARLAFGLSASCVDDQGAVFRLWQPVG